MTVFWVFFLKHLNYSLLIFILLHFAFSLNIDTLLELVLLQKGSVTESMCKDKTLAIIISHLYSINTGILDQESQQERITKVTKSYNFLNQKNFVHFSYVRCFSKLSIKNNTCNQERQRAMLKCCRREIFSRKFQAQENDIGLQK